MNFTNKQIWHITYPVMISLIMEHMIGLTDTAFLGRVGEVELGASAIAGVYYLAFFMTAFGFSMGAQILIGRRNGEGEFRQTGAVFQQGAFFLFILAAFLFAFSRIFTPEILRLMIQSEDVYTAALDYLNWRVYGFFFAFIACMFRAFYVGTTQTRILTANSLVMVLSNVGLNYVLIFGKLGFPAMGIAGAAIASSVAEMVSVLFFVLYSAFRVDRKYGIFRFTGFSWSTLKSILNVSIWTMIQAFISVATWFIFFIAVEHLGERPLAVTNIVRSLSGILFIVVSAFGSTTSSMVSNLIGAGQTEGVMPLCGKVIRMCLKFAVPIIVIVAVFPQQIMRIYTDNLDLIADAVPALWVLLSSSLFLVPGAIWFNAVSGTGNTRTALVMEVFTLTIYILFIVVVIFTLKPNVAVCWTSEHCYWSIMMTLCYLYLRSGKWKNKQI